MSNIMSGLSGWDPRFRTGHFDGKDKVADWIKAQGTGIAMKWSILTSCMYLEILFELLAPFPVTIDGEKSTFSRLLLEQVHLP
jgi:hypothetical protein